MRVNHAVFSNIFVFNHCSHLCKMTAALSLHVLKSTIVRLRALGVGGRRRATRLGGDPMGPVPPD